MLGFKNSRSGTRLEAGITDHPRRESRQRKMTDAVLLSSKYSNFNG
jgi:hypothetical protein